MRRLALLASVLVAAVLAGCTSVSVSPFASVESVDTLRADHDKAIAQVRADEAAARAEFKVAFDAAIADGKSTTEALGAAIAAESAKASGAATAAATVALDAKAKAEAAKQSGDDSTSPLGTLIAAAGSTLLAGILSYFGLRKHDSAPFIGPNGERVPEAQLVAAAIPKTGSSTG